MEIVSPYINEEKNKYYNVVFHGIIRPDYDEIEVKEKLCELADVDLHSYKGKRILSGYSVAIRTNLTLLEGKSLLQLINDAGAECSLVSVKNRNRTLRCPDCRSHLMKPFIFKNIEVDKCAICSGLWFEKNELEKVISSYDTIHNPSIIENLGLFRGRISKECPECKVQMNQYDIAWESNESITVCKQCAGLWMDSARIEHLQAFYEAPSVLKEIEKKTTLGHWIFQFILSLPVEFNLKPKKTPYVTISLIVINSLIMFTFLIMEQSQYYIDLWGLLPSSDRDIVFFINLFSYQFLHGGLFHLMGNMYLLYILGNNTEDVLGHVHFTLFYLLTGALAGVAQTIFTPTMNIPLVGASGAIAGVMACYMVIFRKARLTFMFIVWQKKLSVRWYFLIWVIINVVSIFISELQVAWYAHLSGFMAGLLWSYIIYNRVLEKNPLINYLNRLEC